MSIKPVKSGSTAISPAKISQPRLARKDARHRLFELLDAARSYPVIWMMGPPGCGKTSLVGNYLEERKLSVPWYELDDGDTDLKSFFRYLGMAVNKLSFPHQQSSASGPLASSSIRRYFEDIFARLPLPFVMVFDNYHEIPTTSPLHEVMREALMQIPKGGNVIVISRSAPPPELARLYANQAIRIIGWRELRLTEEETRCIVQSIDTVKLSDEEIRVLYDKTEGWAAGLVLLLGYLQESGSSWAASGRQIQAGVFNYFAREIFNRADIRTQDLLMKTAFLPHMSAAMAVQLSGLAEAGRVLAELNRQQHFIEEHAAAEPAFRYHTLFREFLMAHAMQVFTPAVLADVKRHAGKVLEAAGQFEAAAELYRRIGDDAQITRLILEQAPALMAQGRSHTLENCLNLLPQPLVEQSPWLAYWLGMCRLTFSPAQSCRYFEKAFNLFKGQQNAMGVLLAWSGVVDSIWYGQDDFTRLDTWIAWLDERIRMDRSFPSSDIEIMASCSMAGALRLRQPQRSDASAWMERALRLAEQSTDINLHLKTRFNGAYYYLWRGDFARAKSLIADVAGLPEASRASPLLMLKARSAEAFYYWFIGEAGTALQTVGAGLELARFSEVHTQNPKLYAIGLFAALTEGDLITAADYLLSMLPKQQRANRLDRCHYYYLAGWYEFLLGNLPTAHAHAETALQLACELGVPFLEVLSRLALTQVLFELSESAKAKAQLAQAGGVIRQISGLYPYLEFLGCVVKAQLAFDQLGQNHSLELLGQAMALGREKNFFITTWLRPSALGKLALAALRANIEVDYVQNLVRKRRLTPDPAEQECEHWPWAVKIFTLGRFCVEREGVAMRFSRKAQHRPLELLKALIALGGREVTENQLADVLWPEANGDSAHRAFATTLHRLRKLLGNEKVITLHEGRVTLESRYCWVANWAFERLLSKAESVPDGALIEKAIRLYQGPFLREESAPWAVTLRERLRSKFHRQVMESGRRLEQAGQWEKAIDIYHKAMDAEDGLAEEFCQRLMMCYQSLNRNIEAVAIYHRCCKLLSCRGIKPSPQTDAIYRAFPESRDNNTS